MVFLSGDSYGTTELGEFMTSSLGSLERNTRTNITVFFNDIV